MKTFPSLLQFEKNCILEKSRLKKFLYSMKSRLIKLCLADILEKNRQEG